MAVFPEYLKIIGNYSFKMPSKILNIEYMDGMTKNVNLQSRRRVEVPLTYLALSRVDLILFREWINSIGNGLDMFAWTSPLDNIQYISRIVEGNFECNAISPNAGKGLDGAYEIRLTIEYWE